GSGHAENLFTAATTRREPGAKPLATTRDPVMPGARAEGGNTIGRFRVERQLGSGAFGHVYLAQDPQLDRPVAIKVAKAGMWVGEDDRQRFLREARAAAQLRHPHIVPVYEFGQVGEADYIAYQYVRGTTLRSILGKSRKLATDEAVALLIKIADALHYAHTKQIVHRDVKPENILMDEEGEPHVADFGCARREENTGLITVDGQVMGTPAYMSPEQAAGKSHLADGRSDVWSLGVMFEEMLTGERPFKGTLTEILISIRDHEPKPLRQRDARIPKDLETICQKCLAKNRDERFPTAGVLVEELQRYQRGEPILSRPIGVLARTWRWAQRNRAVASLIAGIIAVTFLGATFSTWSWIKAVQEQRGRVLDQVLTLQTADARNVPLLLQELQRGPFPKLVVSELTRDWKAPGPTSAASSPWPTLRVRTGLGLLAMSRWGAPSEAAFAELRERLLDA
ncbi:MAG TPA: serine/threonine-protein kinase, partial [Pirellulaceae bacterium]